MLIPFIRYSSADAGNLVSGSGFASLQCATSLCIVGTAESCECEFALSLFLCHPSLSDRVIPLSYFLYGLPLLVLTAFHAFYASAPPAQSQIVLPGSSHSPNILTYSPISLRLSILYHFPPSMSKNAESRVGYVQFRRH